MDAFKNETALIKNVLQAQSNLALADSEYQKSLVSFLDSQGRIREGHR